MYTKSKNHGILFFFQLVSVSGCDSIYEFVVHGSPRGLVTGDCFIAPGAARGIISTEKEKREMEEPLYYS